MELRTFVGYLFRFMANIIRFFFAGFFFLLIACTQERSPVPNGTVDIYLDLNQPQFNGFVPGTSVFITGGASGLGIVIYRATMSEFRAFDRMCTSKTHEPHRVDLSQSSNFILECSMCRSRFNITDGSVTQGPASFNLTEYQCFYNQTNNSLWISN